MTNHVDQEEYDSDRMAYLTEKGYRILRFWNCDVINKINVVMGVIMEELEMSTD
jgi:very-short-patch-repair endonuclease